MTSKDGENTFFTKLPLEIRNNIYSFVYVPARQTHTTFLLSGKIRLGMMTKADIDTLFVSKTYNEEALHVIYLYCRLIVPVSIQHPLAFNSVTSSGFPITRPELAICKKHVALFAKFRHVELRFRDVYPPTELFIKPVADITSLGALLPELSHLKTIAISWAENWGRSWIGLDSRWSGRDESDVIKLLVPFEDFQ